ncbi:MAG: glycosyltransferase family 4 protein [Oscillochloridaceae bacterium umkhey_bin13]
MRIGIDVRYTSDHFPGIGRYLIGLARGLAELDQGHHLILLYDPRTAPGRYQPTSLAELPGVELVPLPADPFGIVQHAALPRLARRLSLDLLHSPYYVKPYLGLPCPSVVTIYDLIGWRFPAMLSWRGRLFYRTSMALAIRSSAVIITISESARADLAHVYRHVAPKLVVTPLASERRFRPQPAEVISAVRARYQLPERYVLYLGSNKPHKNVERLLRAWRRVAEAGHDEGTHLVLAGHEDRKHPSLRQLVNELELGTKVQVVPGIADPDLPALYSGATVFAFPSYYEGFGLPPLEAMACGTPVLCAYATSLPEVVGDAALTVDPHSSIEIAEGLGRLLHNAILRRDLSARGLRRAREFSWRRTALGTLRAYQQALG